MLELIQEIDSLPLEERVEMFREENKNGSLLVLQRIHESSNRSFVLRVASKAYMSDVMDSPSDGIRIMLDATRKQLDAELEKKKNQVAQHH